MDDDRVVSVIRGRLATSCFGVHNERSVRRDRDIMGGSIRERRTVEVVPHVGGCRSPFLDDERLTVTAVVGGVPVPLDTRQLFRH